jgi:hypothetical protein
VLQLQRRDAVDSGRHPDLVSESIMSGAPAKRVNDAAGNLINLVIGLESWDSAVFLMSNNF